MNARTKLTEAQLDGAILLWRQTDVTAAQLAHDVGMSERGLRAAIVRRCGSWPSKMPALPSNGALRRARDVLTALQSALADIPGAAASFGEAVEAIDHAADLLCIERTRAAQEALRRLEGEQRGS